MVFAPDAPVTTRPKSTGSGFASVDIDAKGKMSLVGFLADGTKVTASLLPDAEANYRLYALPNKGRLDSYCAAWFEPQAHPDLPGRGLIILEDNLSLYWAKAAKSADTNYRGGILEPACRITMDPWWSPATKPSVITLAQRLSLNDTGDIEPLFEESVSSLTPSIPTLLRMDNKDAVTVNQPVTSPANQSGYKISIIPGTGAYTGSFNLTDGTTKRLV